MDIDVADTVVSVLGWDHSLDGIGEYTLKIRKTPEELKAERQRYREAGKSSRSVRNVRFERRSVLWFDPADSSHVCFLPGLWPRVREALDRDGRAYSVTDRRDMSIRPQLDVSRLGDVEFRKNQDVAVALIASSDCGIIKTTTAFGKSFLIGVLCKCLPTLNIVVATKSSSVVGTLYDYLVKQIPGEVGYLYMRGDTTNGKRVVITTLASLPHLSPEKVQLLLVDECHDVGDNSYGETVSRFCFARRFGFTASDVRNDGSRLVLESLFGPVLLEMSYQEAADAGMVTPMKYMMIPCSACPSICHRLDPGQDVLLKRFSYWCNQARNRVIADFVCRLKGVYEGQILIMVGTLEHAIQLHMRLPWFKVAYYGATDMAELEQRFPKAKYPKLDLKQYRLTVKELDRMRGAFAKGTLRYIISTTVFKQGVNFPKLEVLVRADGDISEVSGIQIPGRLARLSEDKDWAYLIDVQDSFSSWAANRSAARKRLYEDQQWLEINERDLLNDFRGGPEEGGSEPAEGEDATGVPVCEAGGTADAGGGEQLP